MCCSMTRRSDADEARNRGPLVSSSQCLNTKCGQSKRFGTGPEFFQGGGGGSIPDGQKWTTYFFLLCPQFILQFIEGSNGLITEKTILFQGSRGSNIFQGVQLFPGGGGGPYHIISKVNPYNL